MYTACADSKIIRDSRTRRGGRSFDLLMLALLTPVTILYWRLKLYLEPGKEVICPALWWKPGIWQICHPECLLAIQEGYEGTPKQKIHISTLWHTKAENPYFNSVLDIDSGNIEKHNSKFLWIIFLFLSLRFNIEKTGKGYYTGRVWRALQKIYRVYWKAQFKIFMNYIFIFVPKIYQRSNLESDVYSVRRFQNYLGFTNQARKLWRACQP